MSVSVDFVVMFHPLREAGARALAERVGARLVADPDPGPSPSVLGTWRTARAAWLSVAASGADHGLVLQDDIVVCDGFRTLAENVLALHARRVVAFYSPARLVLDAFAAGAPMVELPWRGCVQTQAVAMPARLAAGLVYAGDAMDARLPDDVRLERWLRRRRDPALATVPSLVQHDPDEPAIIPGKRPNAARHARLYVGDTAIESARIDWSGPIHRAAPHRSWSFPASL